MELSFNDDPKYVYFLSLYKIKNDTNNNYFSKMLDKGTNYLQNNFLNRFGKTGLENQNDARIERALQILEKGIEKERQVERQYINSLLSEVRTNTNIDPTLRKELDRELMNIFDSSDKPFNYARFINLINKLYSGVEDYKAILQLEAKRGEELSKKYKNIVDHFRDQMTDEKRQFKRTSKKDDLRRIRYASDEGTQMIEESYLNAHSMAETYYSRSFSSIPPTIDNLFATTINEVIQKIMSNQDMLDKIFTFWSENKLDSFQHLLVENIILQIRPYLKQIIDQTINKTESKKQPDQKNIADEVANNVIQNLQSSYFLPEGRISIQYDEGYINDLLKNFIDLFDNSEQQKNKSNVSSNIFELLQKSDEKNQQQIKKLIDSLRNQEEQLKEYQLQKDPKSEDIRSDIQKTKTKIVNFIKDLLNQAISTTNREDEIKKILKDILTNNLNQILIKIKGYEFSEFIQSFLERQKYNLDSYWPAQANKRADVISIHIPLPNINHTDLLNKINSTMSNIPDEDQRYRQLSRTIGNKVSSFYIELLKDTQYFSNLNSAEFSLRRGRAAWFRTTYRLLGQLGHELNISNQNNTSENSIQALLQLREYIKNTIVVTETMKTFNQYNANLGFVNGSLGPNVQKQIENFNEMFEAAGVPLSPDEMQWLEVAIINCSRQTIGRENKEPIEKYLSYLAAFAVFDEGSAEIQLIAQEIKYQHEKTLSPKIMHIYRLNGLYFPGSYVLQRIYDRLTKTYNSVMNETKNNIADGVHIRATADPDIIIPGDWGKTYKAASNDSITSITVTFISDLLNIVNQLNEAMKEE